MGSVEEMDVFFMRIQKLDSTPIVMALVEVMKYSLHNGISVLLGRLWGQYSLRCVRLWHEGNNVRAKRRVLTKK